MCGIWGVGVTIQMSLMTVKDTVSDKVIIFSNKFQDSYCYYEDSNFYNFETNH